MAHGGGGGGWLEAQAFSVVASAEKSVFCLYVFQAFVSDERERLVRFKNEEAIPDQAEHGPAKTLRPVLQVQANPTSDRAIVV